MGLHVILVSVSLELIETARVMKHLSAMNVVAETDVDTYRSTPLSDALTEPRYRDGIIYVSVSKFLCLAIKLKVLDTMP